MAQSSPLLEAGLANEEPTFTVWLDKSKCQASHADSCEISLSLKIDDAEIYE